MGSLLFGISRSSAPINRGARLFDDTFRSILSFPKTPWCFREGDSGRGASTLVCFCNSAKGSSLHHFLLFLLVAGHVADQCLRDLFGLGKTKGNGRLCESVRHGEVLSLGLGYVGY